jgi:hypothetical protein
MFRDHDRNIAARARDRRSRCACVHVRVNQVEPAPADEFREPTRVGDRDATLDQILRESAEGYARGDDLRGERARSRAGDGRIVPAPLEPRRETDHVTLGAAYAKGVADEQDSQSNLGPSEPTGGSSP